jgi:hypothetical protein
MCPLCLSTMVWVAFGGGSAVSLGALLGASYRRKGNDDGSDGQDASDRHS